MSGDGATGAEALTWRSMNSCLEIVGEAHMKKSLETIRKEVHPVLERLTPAEAKAFRSRFRIDKAEVSSEEERIVR